MEYRLYKGTGFGSNENYKLNTEECDLYLRTMPADSYITITDNKPFNSGAFRTGQAEILIKQSDILGIDSFLSLACFDYLRVLLPTVTTNPPTKVYFYYFIDNIDLIAVKGGEIGDYILKLTIRLDYFNTYKLDKLFLNMDVIESQLLISLSAEYKVNSLFHTPLQFNMPTTAQTPTNPLTFSFLLLAQTNLVGPVLLNISVKNGQYNGTANQILTDSDIFTRILLLGQASKLEIDVGTVNITPIKLWLKPNTVSVSGSGATLTVYGEQIDCTIVENTIYKKQTIDNTFIDPSLKNTNNFNGSDTRYAYGTLTNNIKPPTDIYYSGFSVPSIIYTCTPTDFRCILEAWDKLVDVTSEFEIPISKSADTDFWNTQTLATGIKLITGAGQVVAGAASGSIVSSTLGATSLAGSIAQLIAGSPASATSLTPNNALSNLKVCANIIGVFSLGIAPGSSLQQQNYGIVFPTPYHLLDNQRLIDIQTNYPTIKNGSSKRTWYIRAKNVSVAQHTTMAAGVDIFTSVPTEAIRYLQNRLAEGIHYFNSYIDYKMKSLNF